MTKPTLTTPWSAYGIGHLFGPPRRMPKNFPIYIAAYLPFLSGKIDWESFRRVLQRIYDAGGIPVVNADTGFAFLLTEAQKVEVVKFVLREFPSQGFVVGVTVSGDEGRIFSRDAYQRVIDAVELDNMIEIMVMVSPGLTALHDNELVDAYASLLVRRAILHELTRQFVLFGRLFTPFELHGVLSLANVVALKSSELFQPVIAQRMALKEATKLDALILSGVDYSVAEAYRIADGVLMGAAVICPKVYAALADLRRQGIANPEEMWKFDILATQVQSLASFQFAPDVTFPTFDVGNYRHATAMALWELKVIRSYEQPTGVLAHHTRLETDANGLQALLRTLRETLNAVGLSADLVN